MIPVINKFLISKAKYTRLLKELSVEEVRSLHTAFEGYEGESDFLDDVFNHMSARFAFYEICDEDFTVFKSCVSSVVLEYHDEYFERFSQYRKLMLKLGVDPYTLAKHGSKRTDLSSSSTTYQENTNDNVDSKKEGSRDSTEYSNEERQVSSNISEEKVSEGNDKTTSTTGVEDKTKEYELPHSQVTSDTGYLTGEVDKDTDTTVNSTTNNYGNTETNTSESNKGTSKEERNYSDSDNSNVKTTSSTDKRGNQDKENEYTSVNDSWNNEEITKIQKDLMSMIENVADEFATRFDSCFLHVF